jgi:hypothetical protein
MTHEDPLGLEPSLKRLQIDAGAASQDEVRLARKAIEAALPKPADKNLSRRAHLGRAGEHPRVVV